MISVREEVREIIGDEIAVYCGMALDCEQADKVVDKILTHFNGYN